MAIYGHVGLAGSGKTIAMAEIGLLSRAAGKEVYSNFDLGWWCTGWMLKCCDVEPILSALAGHECTYRFEPSCPQTDAIAKAKGARKGRGFVRMGGVTVLDSWEQVVALGVKRDVFGKPHKQGCSMVECEGCSKGIVLLLDELHGWAPAREYAKLPAGVFTRWSYTRKDGLDVHYSAQHESNIDVVIRRVTSFTVVHQCAWAFRTGADAERVLFGRFIERTYLPSEVSEAERQAEEASSAKVLRKRGRWFWPWSCDLRRAANAYDTYEKVEPSAHLAVLPKAATARRGRSAA